MKTFVCTCGKTIPMREEEFPLTCVCGKRYESFADSAGTETGAPLPVSLGGVGAELTAIFSEVDAKHTASCGCQAKAAEMDRVGIEGVKANREKYLEWMREAYYSL